MLVGQCTLKAEEERCRASPSGRGGKRGDIADELRVK